MGERKRLDDGLVRRGFVPETRTQLWRSADSLLAHGPLSETGKDGGTGLALGYVQSGKTTAITLLTAAAMLADELAAPRHPLQYPKSEAKSLR